MIHLWVTVNDADLGALQGLPLLEGDALVVNAGGRAPDRLLTTLGVVHDLCPGLPVYLQSGPQRVPLLAGLGRYDGYLLDWEQSSYEPVGPWTWEFETTVLRIHSTMAPVSRPWGLVCTAAPLMNRKLRRDGVVWQYDLLAQLGELGLVAQTQGFLARSLLAQLRDAVRNNTDFEIALGRLAGPSAAAGTLDRLGSEVALGDTENSVTPSRAAVGARQAQRVGIDRVYVFGRDMAGTARLLELLRPAVTAALE